MSGWKTDGKNEGGRTMRLLLAIPWSARDIIRDREPPPDGGGISNMANRSTVGTSAKN